ncbi:hypothetical protein G6L37_06130 [Agrobacterium rubi]|nr:hypothetical protein [Agrobacterium rubi]NTF24939.1 hypothetical protein [Agrobacterium rubi]
MDQGIYQFFNGSYVDLDRILEIGRLELPLHASLYDAVFRFEIHYMFQEKPRVMGFGFMKMVGIERFHAIQCAGNAEDAQALFKKELADVETTLQQHLSDLVQAWRDRKAQVAAFEHGART